jgi:U4/U6.U5 tri-snRNP-associated protein 2
VFSLPDDEEVVDSSLQDIKYNLDPKYTPQLLSTFDSEVMLGRSLEGTEYIPGFVGLNNLRNTSFVNVVVQLLSAVKPLRDRCLLGQESGINGKLAELVRKMWNPVNFKGHVSPAEFMEEVNKLSGGQFKTDIPAKECAFGGSPDPS